MADVSVVIPCYNAEAFIADTLESVLAQSDPPRQVIVIDDGSTDGSAAIVRSVAARAPDVVELIEQPNAGESRARNVGIERALGAFVAFLDADDLWLPAKTERQLALLAGQPEAAGSHTRVFNFRDAIDDLRREESERTMDDPSVGDVIDYHYVAPSSLIVRRSVLDEGVRFDEAVRHSEDMLFMGDLRLRGPLRLVDEPLVGKRVHGGQQSRSAWHGVQSLESRVNWLRSRAEAIGTDEAARLERRLVKRVLGDLERRYWQREVNDLAAMFERVRELAPRHADESELAWRRIYPRWVYRVRDAILPARRASG